MELDKAVAIVFAVVLAPVVVYVVLHLFSSWLCKTKITSIVRDEQGRVTEVVERCV